MTVISEATRRVAVAQRRFNEAFEELRAAVHDLDQAAKREQESLWKNIRATTAGKERRPKGEMQTLIEALFLGPIPGGLSFPDIEEALQLKVGGTLSPSTIRQTLYRMRESGKLERYGGKWSRGQNLGDQSATGYSR